MIRTLTGVAERSTAFSCWRIFVKDSTESLFVGCFNNVCSAGLLPVLRVFGFGRFPERATGPVHRPATVLEKLGAPAACTTTARAQLAMQRSELEARGRCRDDRHPV